MQMQKKKNTFALAHKSVIQLGHRGKQPVRSCRDCALHVKCHTISVPPPLPHRQVQYKNYTCLCGNSVLSSKAGWSSSTKKWTDHHSRSGNQKQSWQKCSNQPTHFRTGLFPPICFLSLSFSHRSLFPLWSLFILVPSPSALFLSHLSLLMLTLCLMK